MYSSGLLVLTKGLSKTHLCSMYSFARTIVNNKLYITLTALPRQPKNLTEWSRVIAACYSLAAEKCPNLDVRLLLPSQRKHVSSWNVTIADNQKLSHASVFSWVQNISDNIPKTIVYSDVEFNENDPLLDSEPDAVINQAGGEIPVKNACLGGTFDNLHVGHKILLSCGSISCTNMLTIGITQQSMLLKKRALAEWLELKN